MRDLTENMNIYTLMVLNMSPFFFEEYCVAFNEGGYAPKGETHEVKLWCEPEATDHLKEWLKSQLQDNGQIAPRQARANAKDPFWVGIASDIKAICGKFGTKSIKDIKVDLDCLQLLEEFPLAFVSIKILFT